MSTMQWNLAIEVDEHDGRTRAKVRLDAPVVKPLTGVGLARLSPEDKEIPKIGDELAVARALSDLAHKLFEAATEDIEESTHEPAHLHG